MANCGAMVIVITHILEPYEASADRTIFIDASHKLNTYNSRYNAFLVARTYTVSHAKRETCMAQAEEACTANSLTHIEARVQKGGNNFARIVTTRRYDEIFIRGKCVKANRNPFYTAASKPKSLKKEDAQLIEFEETPHAYETLPISLTRPVWSESTHCRASTSPIYPPRMGSLLFWRVFLLQSAVVIKSH